VFWLANFTYDFYEPILAVVNFICFGALLVCCAILFLSVALDQLTGIKKMTMPALITIIVLFIIHGVLLAEVHIPLLVPPIGTLYFTEFLRIIQYLASITILLLGAYIFLCAAIRQIDAGYGKRFMTGIAFLILLLVVHQYVLDEFGIPIIFPPTMWS